MSGSRLRFADLRHRGRLLGKAAQALRLGLLTIPLRWLPRRPGGWLLALSGMARARKALLRRRAPAISGVCERMQRAAWPAALLNRSLTLPGSLPFRAMRRLAWFFLLFSLAAHMAAGRRDRMATTARVLNLLFRDDILCRRAPVMHAWAEALYQGDMLGRLGREIRGPEQLDDFMLNRIFGQACLLRGDTTLAQHYFTRGLVLHRGSYLEYRLIGRCLALEERWAEAAPWFALSVELAPQTVMAHQNYAGRYDIANYQPPPWELTRADAWLAYDTIGQQAEELFLQGDFTASFRAYGQLLRCQDRLAAGARLPATLLAQLAAHCPGFQPELPVRILPYEWVTQFGHLGLLDAYLKRVALGELPLANHVLLAPRDKVANHSYLAYYDDMLRIVRDQALVDALFPWQRCFGEGFMVARGEYGAAEPWVRAAARAQQAWAAQRRAPLLALRPVDRVRGKLELAALGLPEGAWYVGLHVREGGFYAETAEGFSEHRNAQVSDCLGAIEEITARGGWVIRLGDASMTKLPPLPQVVDYAHSPAKSERMDLFLLATSRFVIGTTSGLTTVALTFGTPMLLINCISNDWQLWSDAADFIPKRVWSRREGRALRVGETWRQPVQGMLINNFLMRRMGLEPLTNSPDEIRAATAWKLDVLAGLARRPDEAHPLLRAWRAEIAHDPALFGAALPALPYLEAEFGTTNPVAKAA